MQNHKKKYEKWKRLCPKQTRFMCRLIEDEVIPFFTERGFIWISVSYHDPEWEISGREIVLERINEDSVDAVSITFDKYRAPRFHIHLIRRKKLKANEFIRSTALVKNDKEYYRLWGKPWYWPTNMWPNSLTERIVHKIKPQLGLLLDFIENGKQSKYISRQS
jgi:hypothetical protein